MGVLIGVAWLAGGQLVCAEAPALLQSQVKGLLIVELGDGSHAGTASQMNATAIPAGTFSLKFNQEVGKMMAGATKEVEKLMRVRHPDDLPEGYCIEFGFADKHSPKDGPSAAVACALMAESILSGEKLDQQFAVTGDLTATGEVRPIGGVEAKLRGASNKDCEVFAIPKSNRGSISDIYVMEGLMAVCEVQVISVDDFDTVLSLAKAEKTPEIAKALEDYKMVRKALKSNPANASHPKVVEKLKSILEAIPDHESARLIALHGRGRGPGKLSLVGSFNAISTGANQLAASLNDGSFTDAGLDDPMWRSVSRLSQLRNDVDVRTKDYLDSFLATAQWIRNNRGKNQYTDQLRREFQTVLRKIDSERSKLDSNREIQEELMND